MTNSINGITSFYQNTSQKFVIDRKSTKGQKFKKQIQQKPENQPKTVSVNFNQLREQFLTDWCSTLDVVSKQANADTSQLNTAALQTKTEEVLQQLKQAGAPIDFLKQTAALMRDLINIQLNNITSRFSGNVNAPDTVTYCVGDKTATVKYLFGIGDFSKKIAEKAGWFLTKASFSDAAKSACSEKMTGLLRGAVVTAYRNITGGNL
jgi:hypothetical protein